jgi:L,D-peptidoglycan transpeptidase YkuD (ErfK/YbiS/YcfS/YnhG family)
MARSRKVPEVAACVGLALLVSAALCGCGAFERSARAETTRAACTSGEGPIDASVKQLVVVTAPSFDSWRAQLQRYARSTAGAWEPVGESLPVVLGRAGYAWGDGRHGSGAPSGRPGPVKREGDGRSPAGVFALGTLHGYAPDAPSGVSLQYQPSTAAQRCVDDPRSSDYNRIVEPGPAGDGVGTTWKSAERMRRDDNVYELALDIEHNRAPVVPGHGSCIFAHVWVNAQTPVAGCTGMALAALRNLLAWIEPGALWVALPVQEYQALNTCWKLPDAPNQW